VIVLPGTMTGTAGTIRIRGLNSLSLTNAPIWVVDGVRFTSGSVSVSTGGTQTTLLNGLNPEEIEDIEIVKGPSAATLYGTDAANGVIVVTTKRGKAGSTRWNWYAEGGAIKDRSHYPDTYAIWGHTPAAPNTQVRCINTSLATGACIKDSVTFLNIMEVPELTPLATGHRDQYGMQVNGGNDATRFFISGDLENEMGPVKLPKIDVARYEKVGTPIRDEWMFPEALQRQSVRANLNTQLSPTFDLSLTTGFTKTNQRLTQTDNNFFSIFYQSMMSPGFRQPGLGITQKGTRGEDLNGNNGYTYADVFQRSVREDIQRFLGSANASWRPVNWLQNDATIGVDLASRVDATLCRFAECPDQGTIRLGSVADSHNDNRNFSAKLTSTAAWQATGWANLKTTAGADYTNLENDGTSANGTQLPPGGQTVGSAAVTTGSNTLPTASKTLGLYLQEQAGFRDRMFLTIAVRSDQNSAFGTNFQRVFYPKASLSWILSDESFFPHVGGLNTFRLRAAFGASGVQPGATSSLVTYSAPTVSVNAVDTPGLTASALGNPNLKPERASEFEGGFDTRLMNNRVNFEFTYYSKKTKDALFSEVIAPSAGASAASVLRNLASIKNQGLEATLTATLIDRKMFGYDVTINGSHNTNKVASLGMINDSTPRLVNGTGANRDSVGMSIRGWYYRTYTYADSNSNGFIEPFEVIVNPTFRYVGNSVPTDLLSISNGIDLLNRKLHINALFDYKGGFSINNGTYSFQCGNNAACPGKSNPNASLEDQAAAVAFTLKNPTTGFGYLQNGQFWRFRELSAVLRMPDRMASRLRAKDASLVLAARNLKVWTKYKGADPEENYVTTDVQNTFASSAPRSYYTFRLNLHY